MARLSPGMDAYRLARENMAHFARVRSLLRQARELIAQTTGEFADDRDDLFRSVCLIALEAIKAQRARRRAEQALGESEARWQFACDGSGDGLWVWNAATDEVYRSRQWKAMLGYAEDEIEDTIKAWDALIHPDDHQRVYTELNKHFVGRTPQYMCEYRVRCKDGTYKWILDRGRVISWSDDGRPLRLVGAHTDISETKRAEEGRLEMERQSMYAQKRESLSAFASNIAHDCNDLFAALAGNLEMALESLPDGSSVRPRLEQAAQAARRGSDLAKQMLAYSGKAELLTRSIDLNQVIEAKIKLLGASLGRNVTLELRLDDRLPSVAADPEQIEQLLGNLVANASEALEGRGGVITLRTGSGEFGDDELSRSRLEERPAPGRFVHLSVEDTGVGMNQETIDRIFDPFFTTRAMRRGLGLPAVLGIVRAHRGAIFVDSKAGEGTAMRVLFPALSAASGAQAVMSTRERAAEVRDVDQPGGRTILLVDDEELVLNLSRALVEHLGFRTLAASSGKAAVEIFEQRAGEIAAILLDLSMPKMDGFTTFTLVRKIRPDAKVILSSGYTEQEATERFTGHNLDAFLQKPFHMQSLRETLERVLKN